ncbi:MAG: hypothetical protein Q8M22_08760 [Actinomycetota bacterium]|nr:hypothetical protein [Actinomycetota bacterium]
MVRALAELWQVVAWRLGRGRARLAPLPAGPAGWVRQLVRAVAATAVSATATATLFTGSAPTAVIAREATAAMLVADMPPSVAPTDGSGSTMIALGRETPYSLAAAAGAPSLRDEIIRLNRGRLTPTGDEWTGGLFPAGMTVVMPDDAAVITPLGPAHRVVPGDCYWDIADEHLTTTLHRAATPREVLEYTESLVSFNHRLLGHDDPALIIPGELVILTDAGADTPVVDTPAVYTPVLDTPALEPPVPEEPAPVDEFRESMPGVDFTGPADDLPPPPSAPPTALAPTTAPDSADSSRVLPYAAGIGSALMLAGGAVGLLETRRRRQLRAASVGARLSAPTAAQARTELLLRSLSAAERLARLDLALRAAAPSLASQAASVQAVVMHDSGEIRLFLRGAATPDEADWSLELHANTWVLDASTSLSALAPRARLSAQPCPALVHVGGVDEGGELFVDLEAVGTLLVRSPHATAILRALAASLAASPFLDATRLFTVGLDDATLHGSNCEQVESLDAAFDAAAISLGSTALLARDMTTFALRAAGTGGESWEPAVIIAAHRPTATPSAIELVGEWSAAAAGGRGLALVLECRGDAEVRAGTGRPWQLTSADGGHVLEPLGLRVLPIGLDAGDVARVNELLDRANDSPLTDAQVVPIDRRDHGGPPFVEPEWALMVRVLGPVEVVSNEGRIVACERSKAVELIVWLSQHRERPTRTAARTALWDLDVRDATFANVVSDARRAMGRALAPAEGEEWITRTLTEDLPLHPRVVTDAELLEARVEHARGLPPLDAIEVLRPGVELLGGLPFAGTGYLWTDAEGITSSLALLAIGAAIELATHHLALGDVEGVFWATGQGLKVFGGHEELIALRMRAHARRGDLAGVRGEWESYSRALASDPWAAAEPAAKLVSLRRELLGGERVAEPA